MVQLRIFDCLRYRTFISKQPHIVIRSSSKRMLSGVSNTPQGGRHQKHRKHGDRFSGTFYSSHRIMPSASFCSHYSATLWIWQSSIVAAMANSVMVSLTTSISWWLRNTSAETCLVASAAQPGDLRGFFILHYDLSAPPFPVLFRCFCRLCLPFVYIHVTSAYILC